MIAEVKGIRGIQFTSGAGTTLTDALPIYKQIQKIGKVQWIWENYNNVELLLKELDPRGVFIITEVPSMEIAEELLKKVEKWTLKSHYTRRNKNE